MMMILAGNTEVFIIVKFITPQYMIQPNRKYHMYVGSIHAHLLSCG